MKPPPHLPADQREEPEVTTLSPPEGSPSHSALLPVDPTTPASVRFRRVSPKLAAVRLIGLAAVVLPVVAASAAVAAWTGSAFFWGIVVGLVVAFAWGAWLFPRQVRAIGYATEQSDFLVRKGIAFRTLVVVPYGRIQYVDVKEGPVARLFGIASVQLHTASALTQASLSGLPVLEAAELRDLLVARGQSELSGL